MNRADEGEGREPGQTAYEARFSHMPPRHFEPWANLSPEVKAIWARVEDAVIQAASSVAQHKSAENETITREDEPPTALPTAIVPSILQEETFVVIQDGHMRLLHRIDRGPYFVPLLELAYVGLIAWNGDTLIPGLVSCGWAEMAPRESRAVRITEAGRQAFSDNNDEKTAWGNADAP